jgi:hypothetical protein
LLINKTEADLNSRITRRELNKRSLKDKAQWRCPKCKNVQLMSKDCPKCKKGFFDFNEPPIIVDAKLKESNNIKQKKDFGKDQNQDHGK